MTDSRKNIRVLGIDPGTRITGYGVIIQEGSAFRALDYGCIRPPTKARLSERYLVLYNGIQSLLEQFSPDCLAVETQFVQKNAQSAIKLGMARGMAILAATQKGIPVYEYTPSKAKKAVVGNGRASKEQVQGMMRRLLNLDSIPEPEDAADALALALCHLQASSSLLLEANIV